MIDALAEMGCDRLWIGAESGSQRILDAMKRKADVTDVQAKTKLLQARGIQVGMFIMLGYDGEEVADIEATVDHLKKANPDVFLTTVAYPIKGTKYYEAVDDRVYSSLHWAERTDRDLGVQAATRVVSTTTPRAGWSTRSPCTSCARTAHATTRAWPSSRQRPARPAGHAADAE